MLTKPEPWPIETQQFLQFSINWINTIESPRPQYNWSHCKGNLICYDSLWSPFYYDRLNGGQCIAISTIKHQKLILHPKLTKICRYPLLAISLAAYMPSLFLLYYINWRNLKHFGCRNWWFTQYWYQLVYIQYLILVLMHVCNMLFMIIDCTGNTLYTGNNDSSNTCKRYGSIK